VTRLTQARLVLATMGLVVWGYGASADEPVTRLVGIGLLAAALLLRFARPRNRDYREPPTAS
jgi:hypothetical protein